MKNAGPVKKSAIMSSEHRERFTTEQLCDLWEKILLNADARRALKRLDEAGFRISHLKPSDATFKHPSWADYIAALPLLPNKPSSRRIHRRSRFGRYWPLVRELRELAATMNMPFVEVTIFSRRDYPGPAVDTLRGELLKTASMLEHVLRWDCLVEHRNPRNALIAELRWTIRQRTGRPRDRELSALIDAAFRAAGYKEGCYIDSTALDRIEKRQKESRMKATKRIRCLISKSSPFL